MPHVWRRRGSACRRGPAPLSGVAGPQERVQRHTAEQIEEFAPVVQILDAPVPEMGASVRALLEQVIVPLLPEVQFVGRVARVRAPLMAVPSLAVPPTRLRDPTDAALEFDEEEDEEVEQEEELEMFDESIDQLEHSSWRPRRLCRHFAAGRCEEGWSCTFAHGERELHPPPLRGAERGRAGAADHGSAHEGDRGAACGCANTDLGNIVAGVQIIPQECACSRGRPLEEIVEVTQIIPCERVVVVFSVQEQTVGVVTFLPQERASSIVVCQCHRFCRNRGGSTACAYRRGADCGFPNATDHGGNRGVFSWHVGSDDLSH